MEKLRLSEKQIVFLLNYIRQNDGEFIEFNSDKDLQSIIDCFCVEEVDEQ